LIAFGLLTVASLLYAQIRYALSIDTPAWTNLSNVLQPVASLFHRCRGRAMHRTKKTSNLPRVAAPILLFLIVCLMPLLTRGPRLLDMHFRFAIAVGFLCIILHR